MLLHRSQLTLNGQSRLAFSLIALVWLAGCRPTENPAPVREQSVDGQSTPATTLTGQIEALLIDGRLDESIKLVQQRLIERPDDVEGLSVFSRLSVQQGNHLMAAETAVRLADLDPNDPIAWRLNAFEWYLRAGKDIESETQLRAAIASQPDDVRPRRYLVQLLNIQGRRFETLEHLLAIERIPPGMERVEMLSLIDLGGPFKIVDFGDLIERDAVSLYDLGAARTLYDRGRNHQQVLESLLKIRSAFPESSAAAAFLGRVYVESGKFDEIPSWLDSLPKEIDREPEYWFALGSWLAHQERHEEAMRAFCEALARDSGDRRSLLALAGLLDRAGRHAEAEKASQTAGILSEILVRSISRDASNASWIAQQMQQLVRPWESLAWYRLAVELSNRSSSLENQVADRRVKISQWESDWQPQRLIEHQLEVMVGITANEFQLPDLQTIQSSAKVEHDASASQPILFAESAKKMGVETTFSSGYPADGKRFFLHQANGGGIAVIDFDLDGYADLYFAQSGGDPRKPGSSDPNQLFRSHTGQRFSDVSIDSGASDSYFSQGVTSADANQDGFPDLIVANIGRNSLYLNQGDGTFRDASDWIEDNDFQWTSSVAVADLNGDALPDLIEVNYIDDPRVFEVLCDGDFSNCQPQTYLAAKDRIRLGTATGRWQVWDAIESAIQPSYGMGIVVANFDRTAGNDLFISNDGANNHFWRSFVTPNKTFSLGECATVVGCAVGRSGYNQACMGIGAGDVDRSGTLDLIVTNFYDEPNNLFLQGNTGLFSDEAMARGIGESSLKQLGFGNQLVDIDNDGWLDAAVLNGHLYNASYANIPFRMQPQLLRGGKSGFEIQEAGSSDGFWQQNRLGRTLATVDLDRDGRTDLVANHLDDPVAILMNESASENWIELELVGTQSERSAVGAWVQLTSGRDELFAWQTSGDGYMCRNEAVIHLGLGRLSTAEKVVIHWPSGKSTSLENLASGIRYLVTENQPHAFASTGAIKTRPSDQSSPSATKN